MNKIQAYIYISVITLALLGVAVFWSDRQGKARDVNGEPTPSIKPVAVVDTSITPPSVPEGKLLPATDADGWGSYTNTRYGITFRNLQKEGHHVVTDEANLYTYDKQAYGMIIGLEDGMNPSHMVIRGGEAAYLCGLNDSVYPDYTFDEGVKILATLSFQDRIELSVLGHSTKPDLSAQRSVIVPIKISIHTGYGFVTRDSYSACENTYVDDNKLAGVEIVYLFFETKDGSYISITYPRNSRMAQTIVSTLRFIE